jgi:hypothetical protein
MGIPEPGSVSATLMFDVVCFFSSNVWRKELLECCAFRQRRMSALLPLGVSPFPVPAGIRQACRAVAGVRGFMLLRVSKSILRNLLEEDGPAWPDFGHLDSHPRVGLPPLVKGDGIGVASNLLPVPLAFDVIANPTDTAIGGVFAHSAQMYRDAGCAGCIQVHTRNSKRNGTLETEVGSGAAFAKVS